MPAEIVNLNKFRKERERGEKERQAEENRMKYGRTKEEKARNSDDRERRDRLLDGARIDQPALPSNDTGRESASDNDMDPGTVS